MSHANQSRSGVVASQIAPGRVAVASEIATGGVADASETVPGGVALASEIVSARAGVASEVAERVAQTMQALATASRVRLLAQLREGPLTVGELARGAEMEQSAVSHQLRVLRHLGLVTGRRTGRNVLYALHDEHIATLLSEAIGHAEHLELGIADQPDA